MPGLPQGGGRERTGQQRAGPVGPEHLDLQALLIQFLQSLPQLIIALYDNSIIANPKAFAGAAEKIGPVSLSGLAQASTAATTAVSVYKNIHNVPVMLHLRLQGAETGETAMFYTNIGDGSRATVTTALQAVNAAVPEIDLVVQPGDEVFANGSAATAGIATNGAVVIGFVMPLGAGFASIYNRVRPSGK